MDFNGQSLMVYGFQGFVSIQELRNGRISGVPRGGGVYMVLREFDTKPDFLDANPGGRFKGRDPSVSKSGLLAHWVEGAHVIYIGKGDELQGRIKQLIDFGAGKPVGHWGGRLVWQVEKSDEFVVVWKLATDGQDARILEAQLLMEFDSAFGRLPFANWKF